MSIATDKGNLKRGDVHPENGKVFWAYGKSCLNGEYWLAPDAFARRRDAAAEHSVNNRESRRASVRRHREKNRDAINAKNRAARAANPELFRANDRKNNVTGKDRARRYRAKHLEVCRAKSREHCKKLRSERYSEYIAAKRTWSEANKDRINAQRRENRRIDPLLALKNRLRARTAVAFQKAGYSKTSNTRLILGCEWHELKAHIETRFAAGMTWENRNLWHVDHIIPLASASTETDLLKLCHFTNLQPLWAFDNMSKGDSLPQPAQAKQLTIAA